jgi:peroxiredoxin
MLATVMLLPNPTISCSLQAYRMKMHSLKIKLRSIVRFIIAPAFIFSCAIASTSASESGLGSDFPVDDLNVICKKELLEKNEDALKLVVFLPNDSQYEGMLNLAFSNYFQKMEAFSDTSKIKPIKKIYIKGPAIAVAVAVDKTDKPSDGSRPLFINPMFLEQRIALPSDCDFSLPSSNSLQDKLIKRLGIAFPKNDNAGASVFLLDQNNKVLWRDDDYQAQGERLKQLERKIKTILAVADPITAFQTPAKPLIVGDKAPNFSVDANTKLSDFKNKATLVTFYPAAFSGTLNSSGGCMMCCSVQIRSLANSEGISEFSSSIRSLADQEGRFPVERFAITSSTPSLLEAWQRTLGVGQQVRFVNDADYSAAQAYSSYDLENGYNRRTVFIIDHNGKIAFIDWDYTREDTETVKSALAAVSHGKRP